MGDTSDVTGWRRFLVEDDAGIAALVLSARRVAVLGIKTEAQPEQPAYYVPKYLADQGIEVIPVPVYFPEVTTILGRPVVRRVADAPPPIDIVDVFRRSKDVAAHVEDILAARPRAVWLQLGIRDDASAERWARAGILVVQDRCMYPEHMKAIRARGR
jgi:predicted CoA-binding protein